MTRKTPLEEAEVETYTRDELIVETAFTDIGNSEVTHDV